MTPALYAACSRAVHVITVDSRVLRAGRASLFVLAGVGYGWQARLLGRRPFIWAVEWGYRLVADHRDFFARFLFHGE